MALEKQNLSISFSKGIDTKADPKQVVAGKLLLLQNATFRSTGRFQKRSGYGVLNNTLTAGAAIASYNDELVVLDGTSVYSYGEQLSDLTLKGSKIACEISTDSIVRNSYQQTQPDSEILNGLMCFAYLDSSGKTLYTVLDQATKKVYVSSAQVGSTATAPKVVSIGSKFIIFYVELGAPSALKFLSVDSANPSITSVVTVANLGSLSTFYDVALVGSNLICAYTDATNTTSMVTVNAALVVGTPLVFGTLSTHKTVFGDASNRAYVGFNSGTAAQYIYLDAGVTSFTGPVTIETISNIQNITGINTALGPKFFYEILNTTGSVSDNLVRKCQMIAGTGTPSEVLRSVGLWSKPFLYNGIDYLVVARESTLQSCYFVIDRNGSVISRIATENGGGLSSNGVLREINSISSTKFQFAYLIKDFVSSLNGDVFTQTGLNSLSFTFGTTQITQTIGNNLNLSGGLVSMYDGQSVVEKNFHLYPEGITVQGYLFGGALKKGVYQYTQNYQWTDSKGAIHESATAIPIKVDFSNRVLYTQAETISNYISPDGATRYYLRFTTATGYYPSNIFIGMQVVGNGIPPSTFVSKITFEFGFYVAFLDQAVTSGGVTTITDIPTFKLNGSYTVNTSKITMAPAFGMNFTGDYIAGNNSILLNSTRGVEPGMTVLFSGAGFAANRLIVQVDNSTVYFQSAITATTSAVGQSIIIASLNAAVMNSTNTITVSDQFFTVPKFFVGQSVFGFRGINFNDDYYVPANTVITAVSYNAGTYRWILTLNNVASFTVNANLYFGVSPTNFLYAGQVLAPSAGFNSSLSILSVSDYSVVVDQVATSSGSGSFITSDVYSAKVTAPTLRVTSKAGVSLVLYRTLVNQTIFYRTSSYSSPSLNDKTIDQFTINDTIGDDKIIGNEQLYTTGDVVDNFPPPPSTISWTYKNRSFMVPSESSRQVWFSKPAVPGVAVEFSSQFLINVPEEGGAITAGAQLDDKNIFFKRGSIFASVGEGPANTGAQNDYGDPQKIASDSGCINQKSIVLIPSGLMFQSEKGIYLLDRSLSVSYIGQAVEAYNSSTVTSAKLIRDLNQVRFSLAGGSTTLVYDYLIQEWSIFTNPEVKDATIYKNTYTYVTPAGKILKETPGLFIDDAASVLMGLTTSWLSFAGFQSFQRIYKMLLIGEYKSPHSLTLNVAYDFKTSYNQTTTIPVNSAPVGAYQYRVDFKIQKCQAIQITLSENQTAPFGEGMNLSSFTLEVGAKKGLNKLPASKSYG